MQQHNEKLYSDNERQGLVHSRLLRNPDRKRSGSILTTPEPVLGNYYQNSNIKTYISFIKHVRSTCCCIPLQLYWC